MSRLTVATLTFLLAASVLGCQNGWIPMNDRCYKYSTEGMNWQGAIQYCGQEGGYLIEINNPDEQASLPSFLIPSEYWIGLSDEAEEGNWLWQHSFTTPEYTNWASGQPSNSGGDEDCANLNTDYFWNDHDCASSHLYAVCEADA